MSPRWLPRWSGQGGAGEGRRRHRPAGRLAAAGLGAERGSVAQCVHPGLVRLPTEHERPDLTAGVGERECRRVGGRRHVPGDAGLLPVPPGARALQRLAGVVDRPVRAAHDHLGDAGGRADQRRRRTGRDEAADRVPGVREDPGVVLLLGLDGPVRGPHEQPQLVARIQDDRRGTGQAGVRQAGAARGRPVGELERAQHAAGVQREHLDAGAGGHRHRGAGQPGDAQAHPGRERAVDRRLLGGPHGAVRVDREGHHPAVGQLGRADVRLDRAGERGPAAPHRGRLGGLDQRPAGAVAVLGDQGHPTVGLLGQRGWAGVGVRAGHDRPLDGAEVVRVGLVAVQQPADVVGVGVLHGAHRRARQGGGLHGRGGAERLDRHAGRCDSGQVGDLHRRAGLRVRAGRLTRGTDHAVGLAVAGHIAQCDRRTPAVAGLVAAAHVTLGDAPAGGQRPPVRGGARPW